MRVQRTALGAAALTLIACGGSSSTAPGGQSTTPSLSITIATEPVASGSTVQASATIKDASGHVSPASNVTWSTSDAAIAFIDASGLITGRRSGTAIIRATSAAVSGVHAVQVVAGPPASATIYSGDAQQANRGSNVTDPLCVLVTDAAGNPAQGTIVTYTVATGGGILSQPTAPAAGINGVAISGLWGLGSLLGEQTVIASVAGVGSVTFKATAK